MNVRSSPVNVSSVSLFLDRISDETNLIDCCVITSSTLTYHCQPGDIVVRINTKECIHTPLKPSVKIFDGISHMVKSIEKHLNRSKGARTVRFLRLPQNSFADESSGSKALLPPKIGSFDRILTSTEAALLLEDQTLKEIKSYIVENNRGSVSYRNSISFRDSLSLSLSLALSSNRPMESDIPASAVKGLHEKAIIVDNK